MKTLGNNFFQAWGCNISCEPFIEIRCTTSNSIKLAKVLSPTALRPTLEVEIIPSQPPDGLHSSSLLSVQWNQMPSAVSRCCGEIKRYITQLGGRLSRLKQRASLLFTSKEAERAPLLCLSPSFIAAGGQGLKSGKNTTPFGPCHLFMRAIPKPQTWCALPTPNPASKVGLIYYPFLINFCQTGWVTGFDLVLFENATWQSIIGSHGDEKLSTNQPKLEPQHQDNSSGETQLEDSKALQRLYI